MSAFQAPRRRADKRLTLPLVLIAASCIIAAPAMAADAKQKAKTSGASPEIAEKQADLGELRARIDTLRKDLNTSEGNKADAADRLRDSEQKISRLQRELYELGEQRNQLQRKLTNLEEQSKTLGSTLTTQQEQLEKLLYRQYLRGSPDSLRLMLNGDDPNQLARDLRYLSAIAQTRAELMGQISASLEQKKTLAAAARDKADELAEVEEQQRQRHGELSKQREERKAIYAQVSDKVNAQRKEIGNLQQDEKRLTQLIDRLTRILAAQAEKEAQAARAAKAAETARNAEAARRAEMAKRQEREREKETPREKSPTGKPAAEETEARRPPPAEPAKTKPAEPETQHEPVAANVNFARLQGILRLPVKGNVSGRLGTPREGGGTWRGVFIRASNGSEVKAIAGGRIVFAEWMRGFGNLLIIDHGDAYLSIYGNNDSLLKQVGQTVKGGETIATVGNSGGNPESGLYFELRHQGQPIDPMKWASLK